MKNLILVLLVSISISSMGQDTTNYTQATNNIATCVCPSTIIMNGYSIESVITVTYLCTTYDYVIKSIDKTDKRVIYKVESNSENVYTITMTSDKTIIDYETKVGVTRSSLVLHGKITKSNDPTFKVIIPGTKMFIGD